MNFRHKLNPISKNKKENVARNFSSSGKSPFLWNIEKKNIELIGTKKKPD